MRQAIRQPPDRVAWMLLLESAWWESLGAADHALLCALPGWHGEAFRFLEREIAEHGRQPWAALRERIAEEPWAEVALALVDGEDPAIEPSLDDLKSSMAQLRVADQKRAAAQVLGRSG
jgi:DNA primase